MSCPLALTRLLARYVIRLTTRRLFKAVDMVNPKAKKGECDHENLGEIPKHDPTRQG